MHEKLVFYTNPMSRGQIARWMLEETGADYEQVIIEYGDQNEVGGLHHNQSHGQGARDSAWRSCGY